MKRVAIVSHGASGGGSERVATLLANFIVDHGYDVYFYAIHSAERGYYLDERVHYSFCATKSGMKAMKMAERSWKLRSYIKENRIDTMISFIYDEGASLLGAGWVKKIYTLRNDPIHSGNSGYKKHLRDWLYRDADMVVFQTPDARDYFDEKTRSHSVVIPNPIKDALPDWDVQDHRKEVLAAGRLTKQKNFAMLLDGFAAFSREHPEYTLTICGDGNLKEALQAQAEQLQILDKIQFPGYVSDVHDRMTKAGIYVSTSDYEGISNSMLEAMGIGIPVICTDCPAGGARMVIQDGENGFLIPVGDPEKLKDALSRLAEDPAMQERFSENARKIRTELRADVVFGRWLQLIE